MLKLKEINWLYRNVDDDTIDTSSKEVIEVVSNTTCKMLEKATEADVQGLQAFTIHKLDTKIVKDSDISQYKLLNVREQAIYDRQSHLDLMCFPNLFPTGRFGENHSRQVKLDFSEYVKGKQTSKICVKFFGLKLLFTMFYITCNFLTFFTFIISEKTELE